MSRTIAPVLVAFLIVSFVHAQEPNTAGGSMTFNGIDTGTYPIAVTVLEPTVTMVIDGAPSAPFILITSPAGNPGALTTGNGQAIDIGTPPGFGDWQIVMDGQNPFTSFLNLFAFTDASGRSTITLPTGQPGSTNTYNLQAGVIDGVHPDGVDITAASYLTVQPCAGSVLTLGDDAFTNVPLVGWTFPFYGTSYTDLFVGSNGYVTFTAGDTGFIQSESAHQSGPPRIADLWDDLSPNFAGTVVWDGNTPNQGTLCRLGVAHFAAAPPYALNTVRVDLDSSGNITLIWPNGLQTSPDPVIGISPGNSQSTAIPMDLSLANGFMSASNDSVYEVFSGGVNPFDLTGRAILFAPTGMSGDQYTVTVQ